MNIILIVISATNRLKYINYDSVQRVNCSIGINLAVSSENMKSIHFLYIHNALNEWRWEPIRMIASIIEAEWRTYALVK